MVDPITIEPEAFYDDLMVANLLEVGRELLARARKDGDLRYVRKGKRILFKGSWLLAWLGSDAATRQEVPA